MKQPTLACLGALLSLAVHGFSATQPAPTTPELQADIRELLSPTALAVSADRNLLYIACATARQVLGFDLAARVVVQRIDVPEPPAGLALTRDGRWLLVAFLLTL